MLNRLSTYYSKTILSLPKLGFIQTQTKFKLFFFVTPILATKPAKSQKDQHFLLGLQNPVSILRYLAVNVISLKSLLFFYLTIKLTSKKLNSKEILFRIDILGCSSKILIHIHKTLIRLLIITQNDYLFQTRHFHFSCEKAIL